MGIDLEFEILSDSADLDDLDLLDDSEDLDLLYNDIDAAKEKYASMNKTAIEIILRDKLEELGRTIIKEDSSYNFEEITPIDNLVKSLYKSGTIQSGMDEDEGGTIHGIPAWNDVDVDGGADRTGFLRPGGSGG